MNIQIFENKESRKLSENFGLTETRARKLIKVGREVVNPTTPGVINVVSAIKAVVAEAADNQELVFGMYALGHLCGQVQGGNISQVNTNGGQGLRELVEELERLTGEKNN